VAAEAQTVGDRGLHGWQADGVDSLRERSVRRGRELQECARSELQKQKFVIAGPSHYVKDGVSYYEIDGRRVTRQHYEAARAGAPLFDEHGCRVLDPEPDVEKWALAQNLAPHPADPGVVRVALGWGTPAGGGGVTCVPSGGAATFTVMPMSGLRLLGLVIAEPAGILVQGIDVGRYCLLSDPTGLPAELFSPGKCECCAAERLRDVLGPSGWPNVGDGATLSVTVVNADPSGCARAVRGAWVGETLWSLVALERQRQEREAEMSNAGQASRVVRGRAIPCACCGRANTAIRAIGMDAICDLCRGGPRL
jgi:hypothetical protein